jgi:hypothetical protein
MEKKGVFQLAEELGFSIVNLEEIAPEGCDLPPKN